MALTASWMYLERLSPWRSEVKLARCCSVILLCVCVCVSFESLLSRVYEEKEESVEPPYVLCINCSESHALGIQILTNEIIANVHYSSFFSCTLVIKFFPRQT